MAIAFQLALADELQAERRRLEWALEYKATWDGEAIFFNLNKEPIVLRSTNGDMRSTVDTAMMHCDYARCDRKQLRLF